MNSPDSPRSESASETFADPVIKEPAVLPQATPAAEMDQPAEPDQLSVPGQSAAPERGTHVEQPAQVSSVHDASGPTSAHTDRAEHHESAMTDKRTAIPEAPRTRWGGIIWGLVFLALTGIGFWSTSVLSADFLADIWLRITPLAVGAGMVLIVGAIALLCALVALARHLQRRSAAQRSPL